MNSNYGKPNNPQRSSGSLGSFDFDIGIGSNKPRSLNDQRNKTTSFSYAAASPPAQPSRPAWQPNKPSWTHQPSAAPVQSAGAASLGGPTSMVGDIFGKSWSSSSTTTTGSLGSGLGIGTAKKDPNLFEDLVSSALGGQGKGSSSNVPLKNATPTPAASASKTAYSMGNLADSLPKSGNSMKSSGSWGSAGYNTGGAAGVNWNGLSTNSKSANLRGPSIQNMAAAGGGGINTDKDPFSNLVGFGSKQQSGSLNSASKASAKTSSVSHEFGDFQNAPTSGTTAFSSSGFSTNKSNFAASNMSFDSKMDDFGMPAKNFSQQNQTPAQSSGTDSFDVLFSSSSGTAGGAAGGQQAVEVDDWGLDSDFGGGNEGGGSTTELEGLPPPPSGVSALTAKNKGMNNQKQGQYADAIKWLSWAVILLDKAGDNSATVEVLSCRASCYKEVGEYKKAVADCTKQDCVICLVKMMESIEGMTGVFAEQVLEHNDANVAVLVQRALLYESMEKYRLGAEDLRKVLKIDPANRVARSTIHRLDKMAD